MRRGWFSENAIFGQITPCSCLLFFVRFGSPVSTTKVSAFVRKCPPLLAALRQRSEQNCIGLPSSRDGISTPQCWHVGAVVIMPPPARGLPCLRCSNHCSGSSTTLQFVLSWAMRRFEGCARSSARSRHPPSHRSRTPLAHPCCGRTVKGFAFGLIPALDEDMGRRSHAASTHYLLTPWFCVRAFASAS